jgi:hypothetical protein
MPRRLKVDVDQSAIDTCHMCHVSVRPTPVGPSPGVFGKFPGVRKFHGCFGSSRDVQGSSGVFGKFRVFLESSGCYWEVPRVFWEVPGRFRKFPGVLEVAEFWDPKNTFCDHSFAKKSNKKQKLVISDRCSMLNLRESEVPPLNHESLRRLEI